MTANDWYNLIGGNIHHVLYELIGTILVAKLIFSWLRGDK